jgi:predicted O-methyltransferase YrrM
MIGVRSNFIRPRIQDKENYPNYLDPSLRLTNPTALIVADKVLQRGQVYDTTHVDVRTENMRAFSQRMANDLNLESIILQVGQELSMGHVKVSV